MPRRSAKRLVFLLRDVVLNNPRTVPVFVDETERYGVLEAPRLWPFKDNNTARSLRVCNWLPNLDDPPIRTRLIFKQFPARLPSLGPPRFWVLAQYRGHLLKNLVHIIIERVKQLPSRANLKHCASKGPNIAANADFPINEVLRGAIDMRNAKIRRRRRYLVGFAEVDEAGVSCSV